MARIFRAGLGAEGATDQRFLTSIIQRTFIDLLQGANYEVDILEVRWLGIAKGKEGILSCIIQAEKERLDVVCLHADSDNRTRQEAFQQSLQPGIDTKGACRIEIVPIIPSSETESWLLADPIAICSLLGTNKKPSQLGFHGDPEKTNDPKKKLEEGLRIAFENTSGFVSVTRAELYEPLGKSVKLDALKRLDSYSEFYQKAKEALIRLNFLHGEV